MITYTRKDNFDRAVGNNSVCKSCAQLDRKVSMEAIEKMKKPKAIKHKKNISRAMILYHQSKKEELKQYGTYRQQTIKS
jgi:hypothetical protein|tara:strand:- start:187 stop:423 length:237 start_codon:yes stop_codon:yes gene_type:complete